MYTERMFNIYVCIGLKTGKLDFPIEANFHWTNDTFNREEFESLLGDRLKLIVYRFVYIYYTDNIYNTSRFSIEF